MKITILAAVMAAPLLLGACATGTSSRTPPVPAAPLDAARFYEGVWYEKARPQMALTDGCVAGATAYTRINPRKVAVRDTCRVGDPQGKERAISGTGTIMDPGVNRRLRVRYLGVIVWEYRVLDQAADGSWFISASPAFDRMWIYTRDPNPTPALLADLRRRAAALGFDPQKLEFPDEQPG